MISKSCVKLELCTTLKALHNPFTDSKCNYGLIVDFLSVRPTQFVRQYVSSASFF